MAGSLDRDIQCGENFNRLLELGCFDREFEFSGYGFLEDGEIRYCVSGKELNIYHSLHQCLFNGIYPTAVMKKVKRTAVPSGKQTLIKQNIKMELVCDLKKTYDETFFQAVWELAKEPAQDVAISFLNELKDKIEGRFRDDWLQIFSGLCQQALENKTLTYRSYETFAHWIEYMRKQMDDDIIARDRFERKFSGFAYTNGNAVKYYMDAEPATVEEKHTQLKLEGKQVTPIYRKSYYFHAITDIPKLRRRFSSELQTVINSKVIDGSQYLYELPGVIDASTYQALKEVVAQKSTQKALSNFIGYGYRWLVER